MQGIVDNFFDPSPVMFSAPPRYTIPSVEYGKVLYERHLEEAPAVKPVFYVNHAGAIIEDREK